MGERTIRICDCCKRDIDVGFGPIPLRGVAMQITMAKQPVWGDTGYLLSRPRLELCEQCQPMVHKIVAAIEAIWEEYAAPAPAPLPAAKVVLKRGGGYDPALGPEHPDNQDPTLPPRKKSPRRRTPAEKRRG